MSDRSQDEFATDEMTVDRRGLLVKGGLAAAGATFLASPAAAFARGAAANAGTIKVAVVTHGDTGSFWSVFKRGVDQDKTLWNWRKLIVDGKLKEARKDCTITMMDYELNPVVTYSIINAWPKKYTGVGLKADSNEVAVEGITLCHEGFEIK